MSTQQEVQERTHDLEAARLALATATQAAATSEREYAFSMSDADWKTHEADLSVAARARLDEKVRATRLQEAIDSHKSTVLAGKLQELDEMKPLIDDASWVRAIRPHLETILDLDRQLYDVAEKLREVCASQRANFDYAESLAFEVGDRTFVQNYSARPFDDARYAAAYAVAKARDARGQELNGEAFITAEHEPHSGHIEEDRYRAMVALLGETK